MGLGRSLLITQSRSGLVPLSQAGAQSTSTSITYNHYIKYSTKCNALPDQLDESQARYCTHSVADYIIENFDAGVIWDDMVSKQRL